MPQVPQKCNMEDKTLIELKTTTYMIASLRELLQNTGSYGNKLNDWPEQAT